MRVCCQTALVSRLHLHCAELSRDGKKTGWKFSPGDEDEPGDDSPEETLRVEDPFVDLTNPGRVLEEASLPTVSRDQVVYRLIGVTSPDALH